MLFVILPRRRSSTSSESSGIRSTTRRRRPSGTKRSSIGDWRVRTPRRSVAGPRRRRAFSVRSDLFVLGEAEADIDEAFRWYEAKRVGLGRKCVDEVDSAFARALEAPSTFPVAYRNLRRIVLKRFPYLVYFRAHDELVQIFSVLHGRRDRQRLRRRSVLP